MNRIDFAEPRDAAAPRLRRRFGPARAVLAAHRLEEVRPVLEAAEAAARAGAWVLGYLRYEAAPAFDAAFATHAPDGPLAWFGVHDGAEPPGPDADALAEHWELTPAAGLERAAFEAAFGRIQQAIGEGAAYQVNLTAPWRGRLAGSAHALFAALQRAQPGGYAAYLEGGGGVRVLSVSPELFFDWRAGADGAGRILTRPMKGTAARGATPGADARQAEALRASAKERAENVMIVDLLRNDLSRIAEPHSVRVPRLFHAEALPTVWQMTSDVEARTRPGTRLADVFGALFPCGSVTGAPKVQAMRLIRELENGPRGVYCGAVGLVRPDGKGGIAATFNVPIRTLELNGHGGDRVRCGIGSGIVWGAGAQAEWEEWAAKRAFLVRASAPFDLLETLALVEGVFRHRAEHLARLAGAAAHFNVPWDAARADACLDALASAHPQGAWRVRLLLDAQGRPRAEAFALLPTREPVRLRLADWPFTEARSEFTRYKTTRRAHYAAFAPKDGVFDTVLYNEAGEVTESTFGNLAMYIDGEWRTPPLECGLLPGVGRAVALREGRVREGVVRVDDLPRVRRWAFINGLRGWLAAELLD